MKKRVLVFSGHYIPSSKGGGPIRSIKNLVDNLSDRFDFYIVTGDRDLGDDKPFSNIITDEWLSIGKAKVFYTNRSELTFKKTADIINSVKYDTIYLNSFFSFKFSMVPLLLYKTKLIQKKPIVIAPRGEFSPGALGLKSGKKKLFINFIKTLGLYRNVIWHATAETEKKDIEAIFGSSANIKVANNLTINYDNLKYDKKIKKKKGELKIVFISRVHPKKNLKKAIEFLKSTNGKIEFNIYGPLEDQSYWAECEKMIKTLPDNTKVCYKGVVDHNKIIDIFKKNHVFLFPTLGENFGHVISEAFIGGCPVIISDQTPWRKLGEKQVGWEIELTNEDKFSEVIKFCVELDEGEYEYLSKKAFEFGKAVSNIGEDKISAYNFLSN